MTTIACSREEMACDSRTSYGQEEHFRCADKVERIGDVLVGCSGDSSAIFKFMAWFRGQEKDRPTFEEGEGCSVLVLKADGIYGYFSTTYPQKICEPFFAIGSGSMAARAAMYCGKTPSEAVAIAIKCDKNSGAPVRNFSLG